MLVDAVAAGVGGMVGMAGALGYGFKCLVDVVVKQLKVQNGIIEDLHRGIKHDLDQHITDCRVCQTRSTEAAVSAVTAAAVAAATAATDAAAAAVKVSKVVHDGLYNS